MQKERKLYLEIVVSAYHTSSFLGSSMTREVLEGYLELIGQKEKLIQRFKRSYYRITREEFEDIIDLNGFEDGLYKKMHSLESILFKLELTKHVDFNIDSNQYKKLKSAYEFYSYKTGHKRDHPFKLYCIKKNSLEKLEDLFIKTGKHSIELGLLSEVKDYLELEQRYVPVETDIREVEKVADACWEIYNSNNKIPREDIHEIILNKYHIISYEHLGPKEYEKKVIKASKQWVRDNEEALDIW